MNNSVFNNNVDTIKWLKAAGIRAVKTFAQALLGLIPAGVMISQVDWKVVLSTAALTGILSLITSVAGIPEVKEGE